MWECSFEPYERHRVTEGDRHRIGGELEPNGRRRLVDGAIPERALEHADHANTELARDRSIAVRLVRFVDDVEVAIAVEHDLPDVARDLAPRSLGRPQGPGRASNFIQAVTSTRGELLECGL